MSVTAHLNVTTFREPGYVAEERLSTFGQTREDLWDFWITEQTLECEPKPRGFFRIRLIHFGGRLAREKLLAMNPRYPGESLQLSHLVSAPKRPFDLRFVCARLGSANPQLRSLRSLRETHQRVQMQKNSAQRLVRQISLAGGVSIVVGGTIGSGIFRSPASIAGDLPGPMPMLLVWLVGGLLVLCGALTLGEVGSAYPYSGGSYVFVREGFGRPAAFLFGWANLILTVPAGSGALAVVFAQYALRFAGLQGATLDKSVAALAILAIVAVMAANIVGVKYAAWLQIVTVIAKLGGLAVLIFAALFIGLPKFGGHFTPLAPKGSFSVSTFGLALVSVLWAYDGWSNATNVGGEIADPRRNVSKSILYGTLIVIGVYIIANIGYLSVMSTAAIGKSPLVAADAMQRLIGTAGVTLIIGTVMISTFGTLGANALTNPRIFFAMGEDGLFFRSLGSVHPRFKTPHIAIIAYGFLAVIYVILATLLSGSKAFESLTNAFVIAAAPFYALMVGSVFVFRSREKRRRTTEGDLPDSLVDSSDSQDPAAHQHAYNPAVHTPLYPATPVLFVVAVLYLLVNSLLDSSSRIPTLITLAILLAGVPVYYATVGKRSRHTLIP